MCGRSRWNGRVWCGLASSHRSWLQVGSVMNNKHHSGRRLSPQASLSYKPPPLLASLSSLALRLLRACCPSLAPRLSLSRTHPGGGAPSCLSSPAVLRARSSPYVIGPLSSVCCWLAPSPWLTESLRSFSNRPRFLGEWDVSSSGCSSSTSMTVISSSAWLPSFGWPVSGGCALGPGSAARSGVSSSSLLAPSSLSSLSWPARA